MANYEWSAVAEHDRSHDEEREVTRLLRTYDRAVARLAVLGVDVRKLRPDPVRHAARDVLDTWRAEFIGTDESDLDAVVAALTRLEEAGR